MNAVMFVKDCGIDVSKRTLDNAVGLGCAEIELFGGKYIFRTDDLKRLVESHELVEKRGGLISSKKYLKYLQSSVDIGLYHGLDDVDYKTEIPLMEQAINLVEQCQ